MQVHVENSSLTSIEIELHFTFFENSFIWIQGHRPKGQSMDFLIQDKEPLVHFLRHRRSRKIETLSLDEMMGAVGKVVEDFELHASVLSTPERFVLPEDFLAETMFSMEIRLARLSDLEEVSILFDLYRQFYEKPSDLNASRDFIKERMEKNESVIFVAEKDGRLFGFTQLYPLFSSTMMKKQWVLNDLYVRMGDRKSGAGEGLMRRAMDFGLKNGSRGLSLQTAVTNIDAQRLYEKLGWKKNETFLTYTFYA